MCAHVTAINTKDEWHSTILKGINWVLPFKTRKKGSRLYKKKREFGNERHEAINGKKK